MSIGAVFTVALQPPADPDEHEAPAEVRVLYCDVCRRWGRAGSTHLCGETWYAHAGDLLHELAAEGA